MRRLALITGGSVLALSLAEVLGCGPGALALATAPPVPGEIGNDDELEGSMARVSLNLEDRQDLAALGTTGWRVAPGLVPGEPNQGLVAELRASPARLPDYDDSWWKKDADIQERRSAGFTFAWYRLHVTVPPRVKGVDVAGRRIWFEANVDNYGEIYIDGQIDRVRGIVTGNNVGQRVVVEESAVPGTGHIIAVLVCNAPLGEPVGTIFMRYATLAFE